MKIFNFLAILLLLCIGTTYVANAENTDTLTMNEVVVTGVREGVSQSQLPVTVSVLDRTELCRTYRAEILPSLMEQVPGVMVTSRGMMGYGVSTGAAGGILVRGLSSSNAQVLVLIDGHPQYNGIFGHSIADSYQTLIADRVEVIRGPASLLYGSNAMGGVVNIITRQVPAADSLGRCVNSNTSIQVGGGSYGTFQAEAANQLRYRKFYSTILAQYGRSDNHRPNMGFQQYGGLVKLGWDISSHWTLTGDMDVTHFDASNPGSVSKLMLENDQIITRCQANIVLHNRYGRHRGAFSVYDNFGYHKINDGYVAGGTPQTDLFNSYDAVAGFSAYENLNFFLKNPMSLTVGLDYKHIHGHAWYSDRITGKTVTTPRRLKQSTLSNEDEIATYVDIRQQAGKRLIIDAGIRLDYHTRAGLEAIPQAGIIYKIIPTGQLRATFSKGFRNPTMREMFMYGTANSETLHAESMLNYEIAWRHTPCNGKVEYGVNMFISDGKNMIQTVNGKNINSGTFLNKGIEADLVWHISRHWSMNTNHSYLHQRNVTVGAPIYKGHVGADMKYGRWQASASLTMLTGLCTQVAEEVVREDFALLNIAVSYQAARCMTLWARGENLLAQRYEINYGYPMPRATFMAGIKLKF